MGYVGKDLKRGAFLAVLLIFGILFISGFAGANKEVTRYLVQTNCQNGIDSQRGYSAVGTVSILKTANSQVCIMPPMDTISPPMDTISYYYGVLASGQVNQHAILTVVCGSGWNLNANGECCRNIASTSLSVGGSASCRSRPMSTDSGWVRYTDPCTDLCTDGERRCVSGTTNKYQVCGLVGNCQGWGAQLSCTSPQTCSGGVCISSCTNDCSPIGTKECGTGANAGKSRTCGNYDLDTCLEWSTWTACPTGQTCSGGVCTCSGQPCSTNCPSGSCPTGQTCSGGVCISSCTNDCSPIGTKECGTGANAGKSRTCGNYDLDTCLEWSTWTACPTGQTCSGGVCVAGCTNDCTPTGSKQCSGNINQTCGEANDGDSCLEWLGNIQCQTGQTCNPTTGQCVLGPQKEYYWINITGKRITIANFEDVVNLSAKTGVGPGVNVTFNISSGNNIIRTGLIANTTGEGNATISWEITDDDMGSAGACEDENGGEVDFYFVASYNGQVAGDSGRSGTLRVRMDCGEPPECISWYYDSEDDEDKQIEYCPDYGLIEGDDEFKASQCNLDCNEAKEEELENYLEQYPGESVTSYYCGWDEDDSTCNFYIQTGGGGATKCKQNVEFTQCVDGYRTATYTFTLIGGPGPCQEGWTDDEIICAASMAAALPFFSIFNMIAAMSIIALVYAAYLFKREF